MCFFLIRPLDSTARVLVWRHRVLLYKNYGQHDSRCQSESSLAPPSRCLFFFKKKNIFLLLMLRGRCFFFKRNKKGQQQAARLMHSPAGLGSGLSAALQTCLSLIVIWRVWTSLGNHTESPECTLVYKIWRSHPKRTFSQLNLKVSGTLSGFRFWGYRHPLSLTTQNPQNVHLCTKSGKSSQTDVFVIEFDGF